MKMRQSLSDWEQAFVKEITLDRRRRDSLRRTAEQRALKREVQRRQKRGSVRFAMLVLALAGVAPQDIAADYSLSAERLRSLFAAVGQDDQAPARPGVGEVRMGSRIDP